MAIDDRLPLGEQASHEWEPIEDLPDDWRTLARPDLQSLRRRWVQEKAVLTDPSRVARLEEQLATRWAIETGIIERLYTIDRGTTETLVDLGLQAIEQFSTTGRVSASAAQIIADQREGLDFLFDYVKRERDLTNSYIKEMHALLLRNQQYTDAVDQLGNRFRAELHKPSLPT